MDPDEGGGDMNDDVSWLRDGKDEYLPSQVPFLFVMEVPSSCDEELKNFHETLFGVSEKD